MKFYLYVIREVLSRGQHSTYSIYFECKVTRDRHNFNCSVFENANKFLGVKHGIRLAYCFAYHLKHNECVIDLDDDIIGFRNKILGAIAFGSIDRNTLYGRCLHRISTMSYDVCGTNHPDIPNKLKNIISRLRVYTKP